MIGVENELEKLSKVIGDNFTEADYMDYDIEYHGWLGEPVDNIHKIRSEISKRMREIYAICQAGLGIEF